MQTEYIGLEVSLEPFVYMLLVQYWLYSSFCRPVSALVRYMLGGYVESYLQHGSTRFDQRSLLQTHETISEQVALRLVKRV